MLTSEVRKWLDGPGDFPKGVELYRQVDHSPVLLALFERSQNQYTRKKLREELEEHYRKYADLPRPEKPVNSLPQVDAFSLPDVLKAKNTRKNELYKETLRLRAQLKDKIADQLTPRLKTRSRLTIAEVCQMMEQQDRAGRMRPFSITYVTHNSQTGRGGEVIHWETAALSRTNVTGTKTYNSTNFEKLKNRRPNHWKNSTRNILPLAGKEVRKLNIWLIFEFNGAEVMMGDAG
jgi:hypothetical protein